MEYTPASSRRGGVSQGGRVPLRSELEVDHRRRPAVKTSAGTSITPAGRIASRARGEEDPHLRPPQHQARQGALLRLRQGILRRSHPAHGMQVRPPCTGKDRGEIMMTPRENLSLLVSGGTPEWVPFTMDIGASEGFTSAIQRRFEAETGAADPAEYFDYDLRLASLARRFGGDDPGAGTPRRRGRRSSTSGASATGPGARRTPTSTCIPRLPA